MDSSLFQGYLHNATNSVGIQTRLVDFSFRVDNRYAPTLFMPAFCIFRREKVESSGRISS